MDFRVFWLQGWPDGETSEHSGIIFRHCGWSQSANIKVKVTSVFLWIIKVSFSDRYIICFYITLNEKATAADSVKSYTEKETNTRNETVHVKCRQIRAHMILEFYLEKLTFRAYNLKMYYKDKHNKAITPTWRLFFSRLETESSRMTVVNSNNKRARKRRWYCGKWILKTVSNLYLLKKKKISIFDNSKINRYFLYSQGKALVSWQQIMSLR